MNPFRLLLVLLVFLPIPAAAAEVGTLTFLEGVLHVIRGTTVYRGIEGMRLIPGDILESADAGFVQLEFAGGTIVALGPSSRLFLFRVASHAGGTKEARAAELVLLSGWLKGETRSQGGTYRYNSPLLVATTRDGTVVLHTSAQTAQMFIESGSASIGEVATDGGWHDSRAGKAGDFFSRREAERVESHSDLDPVFVQAMPVPFRDTLPPRLAHFVGKAVLPGRDHEVDYSEIRSWLSIGQLWRHGFVQRFQPLLANAAFRKALTAHLNDYPEWGPVLQPENYESNTDDSEPQHERRLR